VCLVLIPILEEDSRGINKAEEIHWARQSSNADYRPSS
jgi:hypothetical protein